MLTWQNLEYRAATADQRRPLSAPARAAQRAGMDPESLIFFGQSPAEFAYLAEAESAEERIKSLLGESGAGPAGARRRVVRRPLSGYQAADGSSPGISASEPLSDLLMHLAASRKAAGGGAPRAAGGESAVSSMLSSLSALEGRQTPDAPATPAQATRGKFVRELMLSSLAQPSASLDLGPLDAPLQPEPAAPGAGAAGRDPTATEAGPRLQ